MNEQALTPSDKRHRFPPEIIAHAVWRYCRFALRYRDVAELLAERGVLVTDETVRQWCRQCGQQDANALRRRRPRAGDTWHLDEVFMRLNGETHYRWRAVDQAGNVLAILVQARRDTHAAVQFLRKLLKGLASVPRVLITDKLASDSAAQRAILPRVEHRRHKGAAQPCRERAPADPRARAADAAVQEPGPRPALPRRLRAARQPLPPTPPPPHRRSLSCDQGRTLRRVADGHRHAGESLSGEHPSSRHTAKRQRTTRPRAYAFSARAAGE
jgi:putative transposase